MKLININKKIFYRFVEFTSRLISYDLAHEDYKLIALNQKEANTEIEKKVKRLANSFLFLLNQTSQIFDNDLVCSAYFLLTKKRLSTTNIDKILNCFYIYKDEEAHVQVANMLILINNLKIVRKLEFSLLIGNYILIKNNYHPVIFHETDKKYLKSLIRENEKKDLIEFIYMHEYQTKHGIGNVDHTPIAISLDSLVEVLKDNEKILKKEFKIKHLFIYGGFVKNKIHDSSDIDLLVDLGNKLISYKKYDYISQAQRYLTNVLNANIDILDFSYSLKYSETKEINNAIKIF